MSRIYKSETYLFFIALILYMLVIKANMPSFIYLFYSMLLAIYFFPLKIILKIKTEKSLPLIVSSYTIAWFLTYANLDHYIGSGIILQIFMLLMSLVNLFLLYYFYDKKDDKLALHLLAYAFIPMVLFGQNELVFNYICFSYYSMF